jgi:hypothetical protein
LTSSLTEGLNNIVYPAYSYPPFGFLRLAPNVFFGGHRSFRRDGQLCLEGLKPPLRLYGGENTPTGGPVVITFNHYYRPGFDAWWMALALAAVIPVDIHFVMTGELTYPGRWYAPLGQLISRGVLWRLSRVYGFTIMPPMPPRPQDVEARARAVRRTLEYAQRNPQALLAIAPEGGDQPGGLINWPARGAGRFLLLLAARGFGIVPAGVYEEAGEFCLRFGPGYQLSVPTGLPANEKERAAAGQVMRRIAALVPARLRGPFDEPA